MKKKLFDKFLGLKNQPHIINLIKHNEFLL